MDPHCAQRCGVLGVKPRQVPRGWGTRREARAEVRAWVGLGRVAAALETVLQRLLGTSGCLSQAQFPVLGTGELP